jgi:ubiquinone/menaquinone biosynthesis C-methylase UbiE
MFSRDDWWKDFFSGSIVDFWRRVMPPEATRAEADFLVRGLQVPPGAGLLDVPCGDGRLSLELARRGYHLTGVDISSDFLAAARESSRLEGLEIEWRLSEMRELPWESRFDGAFCAGSSFGFLGDEGDAAFLASVARALKPGARFVIDAVKAAEVVLAQFRPSHEMEVGDIRFAAQNSYDPASGWMDSRYTITRSGRENETREAAHRIYTYREVVPMLEAAGFEEVRGLGSLEGEPFCLGSARLIFVATKKLER